MCCHGNYHVCRHDVYYHQVYTPVPPTPVRTNTIPSDKVALVVAVFIALVVATVFTGGLAAAAVAAGSSAIYIGLLIGTSAALGLSAIVSPFTAAYCDMYKDTYHNGADCGWFVLITSLFALWAVAKLGWEGIKTGIWVEILKSISRR